MNNIPRSYKDYQYAKDHNTTPAEAVRRRRAGRIAVLAFWAFGIAGVGGIAWTAIVLNSIDLQTGSDKLLGPTILIATSIMFMGTGLYFVGRNSGESRRRVLCGLGLALALMMVTFIVRLLLPR